MSDKKSNAATRLAGAAIVVMAVTGVPALAQTAPANDQVVTIENTGTQPLVLGKPEWPAGFVRGAPIPGACEPGTVIHAGGHCELPVRFVPTRVGKYSGELVIPVDGGNSFIVQLTGTGVAKNSGGKALAGAPQSGRAARQGRGDETLAPWACCRYPPGL